MRKLLVKINIISVLISIAISFSSNSAYPENSFCLRVPIGIRYDIAKLTIEAIDILKRGDVSELIKFTEEKSKLGKYEEVASLIGLSGIKDRRLENLLSQTQKKLQALKRCDELKKDGFDSIVVPDGKGGFFVDTLGFKGKWVVRIKAASKIDNGYILRLLKSISIVTAELKDKIDFQIGVQR